MYEYRELRIRIERDAAGAYRTYATGPSGEASGQFTLPFSDLEIENMVLRISGQLARGVRRIETPEVSLVTTFGGKLFGALFRDRIRDLYHDSLAGAQAQGEGLRITLALTDVPELMQLPWEFLYDDPDFLSMSAWTPIVRYLDLPRGRAALSVEPPLRILAMVSSPSDAPPLDVGREKEKLEQALAGLVAAKGVEIDWLEAATLRELLRRLQSRSYHIFHYIGHGAYDATLEDGVLLLEDEYGKGERVSGVRLGTILADHVSMRLAVLNSCEGGRAATEDPFSGVASSLVQKQMPAVVAMQFEITDEAAIDFAEEFYTALGAGYPVDSALAEGRKAIYSTGNDLEWGTPVLLLRVRDGRIFDIPAELRTPRDGGTKRRKARPRQVRVTSRRTSRRRAWLAAGAAAIVLLAGIGAGLAVWFGGGSSGGGSSGGGSSGGWSRIGAGDPALGGAGHQEMRAVAALAGGEAVAAGSDGSKPAVWTFNGSTWSRKDLGLTGVAYGVAVDRQRNRVVVVGSSGRAAAFWTRSGSGRWGPVAACSNCGDAGTQVAHGVVARSDGTFVAVGTDAEGNAPTDAAVWMSSDGATWQRLGRNDRDLGGVGSQVMSGVILAEGRLFAFGKDGGSAAVWWSKSGEDWTEGSASAFKATAGHTEMMTAAAHIGSRLVGVGWERSSDTLRAAAWVRASTHGWDRATVLPAQSRDQEMVALAAAPPELLAVGYDQRGDRSVAAVWLSSPNSRAWTPVSSTSFRAGGGAGMGGVTVLTDKSMLAVGSVGSGSDADAAAWRSK